jgi:putative ABC transport system permease protein
MQTLWQDLRFSLRILMKHPGFTSIAVLTLALGIGANTAIFSVVNAALLRALPYQDADRLVVLREAVGNVGAGAISYPNFLDWQSQNTTFEAMAAYSTDNFNLAGQDKTGRIPSELVTPDYFTVLGINAQHGRTFSPAENDSAKDSLVAVLGYGLWQRQFGGDAAVIGKTIKLNEAPFTVIGIMPEGFKGFDNQSEIWVPMAAWEVTSPQTVRFHFLSQRGIHFHRAIGRLKQQTSLAAARAEMDVIGAQLAAAYPADNKERGVALTSARDEFFGAVRQPLLVLLGAVGFVLLIACANVANLLLVRAVGREREIAIRTALGAGRMRLVRQLLTEASVLALCAGATGLLISLWSFSLLAKVLPLHLPSFVDINLDYRVLAFTSGISVLTGLALGLAPALQLSGVNLSSALKEGGRTAGTSRRGRWLRQSLVVAELALTLILLIGAGLMLKSFLRLQAVDLGFNPSNLLLLRFDVPNQKYQGAERSQVARRVVERVEALTGVEQAAVNYADLLRWGGISFGFTLEGREPVPASEQVMVPTQSVTPNYFRTLGIPLLSGRDFNWHDDAEHPLVAIVSESFVRRYFPDGDALGKRYRSGTVTTGQSPWITIVGVVGDIRMESILREPASTPLIYTASLQGDVVISLGLLVRTSVEPLSLVNSVREELYGFDKDMPVYGAATVAERIDDQSTQTRSYSLLIGLFAALALLLATVGIYGVLAYSVTQRTHEIGVRIALGARAGDVVRLMIRQGLTLAVIGVGIGLAGAVAASRLLKSVLFNVSATDLTTFALLPLVMLAVALVACWIPARRATRVDPMTALRCE